MSDTNERLYQLEQRFEQHELNELEKFDRLIEAQQINTDSIAELAGSVATLVEDTSSIVELQRDFQGTMRLGNGVQRFMLWCLKWGMIGTGMSVIVKWVVEYFGN